MAIYKKWIDHVNHVGSCRRPSIYWIYDYATLYPAVYVYQRDGQWWGELFDPKRHEDRSALKFTLDVATCEEAKAFMETYLALWMAGGGK